jgi:hypothetical protein
MEDTGDMLSVVELFERARNEADNNGQPLAPQRFANNANRLPVNTHVCVGSLLISGRQRVLSMLLSMRRGTRPLAAPLTQRFSCAF